MKGKYYLKKFLIIFVVFLIILVQPIGLSANNNFEEKRFIIKTTTDYYSNSIILIIGKCKIVQGPLFWIFGLYIPFFKKSFLIRASGEEGEQLNVMIRGNKFATYIDVENILIEFNKATGILFWGQKSILTNSLRIFARCKAENIWVTTYD
ncbi:MAG: hypothetical protein QHH15_06825 [Candidatus Thermoplasmatota archaeon]|jgi:hypothetical protein|nr:hypothetical protein [Candidatus Thermoplasmatota archaeon]